MNGRALAMSVVCALAVLMASCASARKAAPVEPITYEELTARYNERTESLQALRGRGVVNFRWKDAQGDEQWEQGNLDIQIVQPSRVVFRVHKLGETFLWVGCDEERYWMIDLLRDEDTVAYVGRHDALTAEKAQEIGLLAPPRDLVTLMGIRSLPTFDGRTADLPEVETTESGWRFALPAESGAHWVYDVDGLTARPTAIELVDARGDRVVRATLGDYQLVDMTDKANIVHMAMDVEIDYPEGAASMRIDLDSANDEPPRNRAFDFERLVDALRPMRTLDLDAEP
ncbi:MAG: hypothetical protein KDA20_07545 [Phycisphaerales bacterium]|nr:hypothetical protein [Phycisphaerales bacterium]